MKHPRHFMTFIIVALILVVSMWAGAGAADKNAKKEEKPKDSAGKVTKSNAEWQKILTPEQYRVMRLKGTERAFTGEYNDFKGDGVFVCAACNNELFSSTTKYDSGTGWPSFWSPIVTENVGRVPDVCGGMVCIEVTCSRCDAHLGHVFEDGPQPTGLRYCINSVALKFIERKPHRKKPGDKTSKD